MTQKLDFWQVTDDPIEKVVALIAKRALGGGERVLVVSADPEQRAAISRALWQAGPDSFLANGAADAPEAERQPILIAAEPVAANGASHLILADGTFRETTGPETTGPETTGPETTGFARVFLLFPPDAAPAARVAWRAHDGREDVTRAYFAQEDGRWVKKG
jgi:DNA polymerase-3 subunit chi